MYKIHCIIHLLYLVIEYIQNKFKVFRIKYCIHENNLQSCKFM